MYDIFSQINNSPGYTTSVKASENDLKNIRSFIEAEYAALISALPHHDAFKQMIDDGISNYHKYSHLVNHDDLWSKNARCLCQEAVNIIKRSDLFNELRSIFGFFSISKIMFGNQYDLSREEIYWRLVRPGKREDVGSLHADSWFHSALNSYGNTIPKECKTVKVWLPIYCEPGLNGLLVVIDSHQKDWLYDIEYSKNMNRPILREQVNAELISTIPGQAIIFGDRLLHGGSINQGSKTRVSIEITLILEG